MWGVSRAGGTRRGGIKHSSLRCRDARGRRSPRRQPDRSTPHVSVVPRVRSRAPAYGLPEPVARPLKRGLEARGRRRTLHPPLARGTGTERETWTVTGVNALIIQFNTQRRLSDPGSQGKGSVCSWAVPQAQQQPESTPKARHAYFGEPGTLCSARTVIHE